MVSLLTLAQLPSWSNRKDHSAIYSLSLPKSIQNKEKNKFALCGSEWYGGQSPRLGARPPLVCRRFPMCPWASYIPSLVLASAIKWEVGWVFLFISPVLIFPCSAHGSYWGWERPESAGQHFSNCFPEQQTTSSIPSSLVSKYKLSQVSAYTQRWPDPKLDFAAFLTDVLLFVGYTHIKASKGSEIYPSETRSGHSIELKTPCFLIHVTFEQHRFICGFFHDKYIGKAFWDL